MGLIQRVVRAYLPRTVFCRVHRRGAHTEGTKHVSMSPAPTEKTCRPQSQRGSSRFPTRTRSTLAPHALPARQRSAMERRCVWNGARGAKCRALRDLGFFLSSAALVASGGGRTCTATAPPQRQPPECIWRVCIHKVAAAAAADARAAAAAEWSTWAACTEGMRRTPGLTICRVPPVMVALAATLVSFLALIILETSCRSNVVGERGRSASQRHPRAQHENAQQLVLLQAAACGERRLTGRQVGGCTSLLASAARYTGGRCKRNCLMPRLLELNRLLQHRLLGLELDATCEKFSY